jgi:hypothetical protein
MGPGTHFSSQHDARRQPDGTLTLFDNDGERPRPGRQSRVLVLRLDEKRRTAALVRSYAHNKPLLSTSQGNAQFLPDGHVFVGWGSNPYFTEFDRNGRVLLDVRFGSGGADSYRAFRYPWTGRPSDRPAVVVRSTSDGQSVVAASWNGATEVARWRVLAGREPGRLQPLTMAAKDGFETSIRVPSSARYVAVQALDRAGGVLGSSRPVPRSTRRPAGSAARS